MRLLGYRLGENEWIVTIPIKLFNAIGHLTKWKYEILINGKWQKAPELVALSTLKKRILQIIFENTGQRFRNPEKALEEYFLFPQEKIALFGLSIGRPILTLFLPLALFAICLLFWHRTWRLENNNPSQNELWVLLKPIGFVEKGTAYIYALFLMASPLTVGWMIIVIKGDLGAVVENPIFPLIFLPLIFSEILLGYSIKEILFKTTPDTKNKFPFISEDEPSALAPMVIKELPSDPEGQNNPLPKDLGQQS